jgi:hypothetical protein
VIRRARPAVMAVRCIMTVNEGYNQDRLKCLMVEVVFCRGAVVEVDRLGVRDAPFINFRESG